MAIGFVDAQTAERDGGQRQQRAADRHIQRVERCASKRLAHIRRLALFVFGARRVTPVETALMGALEVPITPLWVWLVFDEAPTAPTLAGGALVLVAVLGHILWTARR